MTIAISILAIFGALIPVILRIISEKRQDKDALKNLTVDELHIGTDRVRKPPTV